MELGCKLYIVYCQLTASVHSIIYTVYTVHSCVAMVQRIHHHNGQYQAPPITPEFWLIITTLITFIVKSLPLKSNELYYKCSASLVCSDNCYNYALYSLTTWLSLTPNNAAQGTGEYTKKYSVFVVMFQKSHSQKNIHLEPWNRQY